MKSLDVLFTPADFAALKSRKLDGTLCVVFDVFRATSSMVTALANGAEAIIPVAEIPEALAAKKENQASCSPANATASASAQPSRTAPISIWAIPRANSRRKKSTAKPS